MVTFATLVLALVAGTLPVEVVVEESVASVEIRLDGRSVRRMSGPPWRLDVDFGETLQPHELVAVARDASGHETSRARQMVNLPRPAAEMTLSLLDEVDGRYRAARASWDVVGDFPVEELRARFDGSPVEISPSGQIELPPYDPDVLHHLVVQARFEHDLRAEAAAAVGGVFGGSYGTELTSIAVALRDGIDRLPSAELDGWFRLRGEPLEVVAVDKPPASILLVRDRAAEVRLESLWQQLMRRRDLARPTAGWDGLWPGDSLYLVDTVPRDDAAARTGAEMLFLISPDLSDRGQGQGVISTLAQRRFRPRPEEGQLMNRAVAAAGLRAAGLGTPRAVVHIVGSAEEAQGDFRAENVEQYLETLQVPLLVWSVDRQKRPGTARQGVIDVSRAGDLLAALRELRTLLDRQRIVWVEGEHLPQHIELSPRAREYVRFAGRPAR